MHINEDAEVSVVHHLSVDDPPSLHLGADEVPFVDLGEGNMLKVLQVFRLENVWITENIFQRGFESPKHVHTGNVWGHTTSGAWKYKESDFVNRAGSFLYEPASAAHTLQILEDDTHVRWHIHGANLNLGDNGVVTSIITGESRLAYYFELCELQGFGRPPVLIH
ncbi:MAG: 2,4'-dihydroxyacetophenone dioxygenase family protein [Acidimicrobiales bacterium]